MKKFLVLYMANQKDFEKMIKVHSRAAKEGNGRMDEVDR